ncbi:flagellar hook-associated protein FlgK [Qipengyuania sp.]|uniref:flagellar hook-associated protein FlgK n=1 Tax=Qipengyuania sp. TaxID=2004515 RepID=UPI0035C7A362
MASDLMTIAKSGAKAARSALDVTAQNIANANTEGYVRRSIETAEVANSSGMLRLGDFSLSGVRVAAVNRNADMFRQLEVRRTGADAARGSAALQGMENIEAAIEQSGLYGSVVAFEASIKQLASDPTANELRAAALAQADHMAQSFNLASSSLDQVGEGARFSAQGGVDEVNVLAEQLARTNTFLSRAAPGGSDRAMLLDQRDNLLAKISKQAGVTTSFNADGQVDLRLGGASGPLLVTGSTRQTLAMATAGDGTISFDVGGTATNIATGGLAGHSATLSGVVSSKAQIDAAADNIINLVNASQAGGVDLAGNPGNPIFSGSGAAGIAMTLASPSGIATAPAGSPARSLDSSHIQALANALDSGAAAGRVSDAIFSVSSTVANQRIATEALETIASKARIALDQQSGVDLDEEAANLVRYQQAFQASGRAMQVASDLFDTLLGIAR